MRTIVLHGELGERFGSEWKLDVRSPAEAMRAIGANCPKFFAHLVESQDRGVGYEVLLDREALTKERLSDPFGRETLHVVPVIGGAKSGGRAVLIGAALVAFAVFAPYATTALFTMGGTTLTVGALAGNIGIGLVLAGTAQLLTGTPKTPQGLDPASELPSYFFSGPANTVNLDSAVPVGYGRAVVGSVPVSAGVVSDNRLVY